MAYPVVRYNGDDITCYPSSNATDDGKLQLEFNMARLVTRLSSKNFCIVNPSFELTLMGSAGSQYIQIGTGQCSINGMDLIMSATLTIDPPSDAGTYYLGFKLARDSSDNVMGDLTVGVTVTFSGVYLTYFDEKDTTDMDILWLGSFDYDGSEITNLVEDEDKYGRLWAEDVLCKLEDPKHPDITRLTLQEYIYNLPDYYMSKEGDTTYGSITVASSETTNNAGIIMNVDETSSHLTIKDPTLENDLLLFYGDVNQDGVIDSSDLDIIQQYLDGEINLTDTQKKLADVNHDGIVDEDDMTYIEHFIAQDGSNYGDTGNIYYILDTSTGFSVDVGDNTTTVQIETAQIYESSEDNILHIHNDGDICVDSEGKITLEADDSISISTESAVSPILTVDDDKVSITDPTASNLEFSVQVVDSATMNITMGAAIWQYNSTTKYISLLQDNVDLLDVAPSGLFENNLTVQNTIYIDPFGDTQTYLKQTQWYMSDDNDSPTRQITLTPSYLQMLNSNTGTSEYEYILLKNSGNSTYTQLYDNGKIELYNSKSTSYPLIYWRDGTSTYDVNLYKIYHEARLNLEGGLTITGTTICNSSITGNGLITSNGVVSFTNGSSTATITQTADSTTLKTNGSVYIGASGNQSLYAGNLYASTGLYVGDSSSSAEFSVDSSGNVVTTGTIQGAKVYGAVYNGVGEIFEKDENETIEYGDVVCMGSDGLVHKVSTMEDLDYIIGICSNTIGFELGRDNVPKERQVEVEMLGQIWVKTNNDRLQPRQMVKVLCNGTVDFTSDRKEKFAITETGAIDGKVRVFYKG